ncbi:MAG: restriction endonuclease subunit S, partial [Magnetococcales bacterium]|nr:restriction endonuclease subunit S [Magnetococcales bacterium]
MSRKKKRPLVPRLRFPEFRESGGWEEQELANFLTESRIEGSAGDVAKKITVKLWGKGVFAKQETIRGSENTRYFKRSAGQFIYSKLDFLNQAFGIVPTKLDGFESTVDLPCFDISEHLNASFLLEYVKREEFYKKNGEIADGGRKAKRIQAEVFLSFKISLPQQEEEQQKIADCLSSLDDLITAHTQKIELLKRYKKGLMQQLFPAEGETVPRLRFPEFREAWALSPMSSLYSFKGNNSLSRDKLNYEWGSFRNIHYGDIHTKFALHFRVDSELVPYINNGELHSAIRPENYCMAGDMVFADASEDITDIGKAIEIIDAGDAPLVSGLHTILAKPTEASFALGFGAYLFSSEGVRKQIQREAQGAKVLGLSASRLGNVQLHYPTETDEQQKIADCLSSLDDLITA